MSKKQYKAIIFDVDGTLVPNNGTHIPSEKVITAVKKAMEKVHVSIATSRPIFAITAFIEKFDLQDPVIVNGGAQIVDLQTKKTLWGKPFSQHEIHDLIQLLHKYKLDYFFTDSEKDFKEYNLVNPPLVYKLYSYNIDAQLIEVFLKETTTLSSLSFQKVPSWEKGRIDLHVSHAEGTKQHGVFEIAKILGINTDEIIGVGDGYNDFPLLMACGLKVAMGNAVDELKAIADYIAPTADDNGVVEVIEKFIL